MAGRNNRFSGRQLEALTSAIRKMEFENLKGLVMQLVGEECETFDYQFNWEKWEKMCLGENEDDRQ